MTDPIALSKRVMARELGTVTYHVEVPITVKVTHYQPGTPTKYVYGPTGGHPGEAMEIEAELYDPSGAKADWVRDCLDDRDWQQIEQDFIAQFKSEEI